MVVIPSRSESIPMVFSEALQAGKPLVVTDVGDMGTLVRRYGLGKVVPPERPDLLAQAMREMAAEDRGRYAPGIEQALKLFDIREVAAKFLRIISGEPGNQMQETERVSHLAKAREVSQSC
jgi:glycosyltransferase involved in cell wall biosynthesis